MLTIDSKSLVIVKNSCLVDNLLTCTLNQFDFSITKIIIDVIIIFSRIILLKLFKMLSKEKILVADILSISNHSYNLICLDQKVDIIILLQYY